MVNTLSSLGAPPEESSDDLQETSVTLAEQMDGRLLSPQDEELRAKLKQGQERLESVLETVGIPPDQYTPQLLANWIAEDPNMLLRLTPDKLSEEQKLMLTYLLGGCIGNTVFYIYLTKTSSSQHTARQLLRAPSLVRKLRETLLFHPENFHDAGELKKLQEAALLAHLREFPEEAVAFADRCKREGRQALVERVIGEVLQDDVDKDHLRRLFPWFPFRGETKDFSAEEYEQKFERDERAASEYDAYDRIARQKNLSRTFEDEEEEEIDRPRYCEHPLFDVFKGHGGLYIFKRSPL